jgi:large subunit ribosomal protein L6
MLAENLFVLFGKGGIMSKIGRKPIVLGKIAVQVDGQRVIFKGPHATGEHALPDALHAYVKDQQLFIVVSDSERAKKDSDINRVWGLHRALLSNKIMGSMTLFQTNLQIIGVGYKAAVAGGKITFSLGYSHKIDFILPEGVAATVDKSGQNLQVQSSNKEAVGLVCGKIKAFRPPEPYKGKGVRKLGEIILRKAGKAKSSS